jgi:hypothetical protein
VIPKSSRTTASHVVPEPSVDYNDPSDEISAGVTSSVYSVQPPPTSLNRFSAVDDVERHPDYDLDDTTNGPVNGRATFSVYNNVVNDIAPPMAFSSNVNSNGYNREYQGNNTYYSSNAYESPKQPATSMAYSSAPPPPSFASSSSVPIPPPPPAPPLPVSFSSLSSYPSPLPSSGTPRVSGQSNGPSSVPPQVQKQLEDSRKRDESHAALMAAVNRRRKLLESTDNEQVGVLRAV